MRHYKLLALVAGHASAAYASSEPDSSSIMANRASELQLGGDGIFEAIPDNAKPAYDTTPPIVVHRPGRTPVENTNKYERAAKICVPGEKSLASLEETATKANSVSEKEFARLAKKHKLNEVPREWTSKEVKSLSDVRRTILKHKPLDATSLQLHSTNGGKALKVAGAVGSALWVFSVVEAFVTNTTTWGRAAAITAIIPFVGCTVNAKAQVEASVDTGLIAVDSALCFLGDALIVGGLVPAGVVVHLARIAVQAFTPPPEPPTKEKALEMRNQAWKKLIDERVFRYIYSHDYNEPNQAFAFKLNNSLVISALSLVSNAATTIGKISATSPASNLTLQPGTQPLEPIKEIEQSLPDAISQQNRNILLSIVANFSSGEELTLKKTGEQVNQDFITRFTSQENVEAYSQPKWKQFLKNTIISAALGPLGSHLIDEDPYQSARIHLNNTGEYLKTVPVTMPGAIDTAFVLGQSKGLTNIDEHLLSAMDYMKQEAIAKRISFQGAELHQLAMQHAVNVIKVIQGRLKEEEMTRFNGDDAKVHREAQLLLAMKCGWLYEKAKIEQAEARRVNMPWHLSPEAPKELINPLIPPIPQHPETKLVSLMLGLEDGLLDTEYEKIFQQA